MNVRIPYKKLKAKVIETNMTWAQIKDRDWQFVLSDFLTVEEIASIRQFRNLVLRWLKQDFKERQYIGTLKSSLFNKFDQMSDYLTVQGLSSDSGVKKLDRAFREWKEAHNG